MQPMMQGQMQQQMQPGQPGQDQEESGEGNVPEGQESGEFTINSDQIEEGIKKQLDQNQIKALNRILDAGNTLLFSKETHDQIMQGLNDDDDTKLADELGKGGISIANVLFEKSGGTMPQELIIPAGVILLARVAEFLKQTGHRINDEIFHEAVMTFNLGLMQQTDPEFHDRVKALMDQGMDIIQAQEVAIKERQDVNRINSDSANDIDMPQQMQQPGLLGRG